MSSFTPVELSRPRDRDDGFTLVEVLVVMLIIAILLALVIGIAAYAKQAAMEKKTIAGIEKINMALNEYYMTYGRYPAQADWTTKIADKLPPEFTFKDAWGTLYNYKPADVERMTYVLWSNGKDKTNGTPDDVATGR